MGWSHTCSCDWPFQCFLTKKASTLLPTQPKLSREKFFWRQGGFGPMSPSSRWGVPKGCSAKPPPAHPPALPPYILTSSTQWGLLVTLSRSLK